MHTHPTPSNIKTAILIEVIATATKYSIPPVTIIRMIDAIESGIKRANEEHDQRKEIF